MLAPVSLFVDTSVWSLALRRDIPLACPEVLALRRALENGETLVTTGIVLQKLLLGFSGARAGDAIVERFRALPYLAPDRRDHVDAALLRNLCRRHGVQLGTIDALLAQLCIHYDLTLLTTDHDFAHAAIHCPLKIWGTTP